MKRGWQIVQTEQYIYVETLSAHRVHSAILCRNLQHAHALIEALQMVDMQNGVERYESVVPDPAQLSLVL